MQSSPVFTPSHFSPILRILTRTSHPPTYLRDYVCNIASTSKVLSVSSEACLQEPKFYHQAASHHVWQEAMMKEFQALEAKNTWYVVALSVDKKAIPCK